MTSVAAMLDVIDLRPTPIDIVTQGEALDIASRALLRSGVKQWEWAHTAPGRSVAWVVEVGNRKDRTAVVLVDADGVVQTIGR